MGIWQTLYEAMEVYRFSDDLLSDEEQKTLLEFVNTPHLFRSGAERDMAVRFLRGYLCAVKNPYSRSTFGTTGLRPLTEPATREE